MITWPFKYDRLYRKYEESTIILLYMHLYSPSSVQTCNSVQHAMWVHLLSKCFMKKTASWGVGEFKRHSSVVPSEQSKSDISERKVPNYRRSTFCHITFLNILKVCAHCLNYPLGCSKLGADNKHWILRFGTVRIRVVKPKHSWCQRRNSISEFCIACFTDVAIISSEK